MTHEKCKYYFETEIEYTKNSYCSLTKTHRNITYKEIKPCCGIKPSKVILDNNQPLCSYYKELKK